MGNDSKPVGCRKGGVSWRSPLVAEIGDVGGVLGEGGGEAGVAGAIADEVEVARSGGMKHGPEGGEAGIGDGAGGKAGVAVGVIGGVGFEVRGIDGATVAAIEQGGVDDGGIGLEGHALREAILKDAGDEWPLGALRDLFFDDGGKGDGAEGVRAETEAGGALAEALDHDGEHGGGRGVAREAVGIRVEEALERGGVAARDEIGDEGGVAALGGEDVPGRAEAGGLRGVGDVEDVEAFGDDEGAGVDVAADDAVVDVEGEAG